MNLSSKLPSTRKVLFSAPHPFPSIPWTFNGFKLPSVKDCNEFFSTHSTNVPTYARYSLPTAPTDIKGVDPEVYSHMNRRQMAKQLPKLASNRFFNLIFFPESHHIASVRKSTIAYMFSNKGGTLFNDGDYARLFTTYKGTYKKDNYFSEKMLPMDSAIERQRFRRLVKNELYEAILKYTKNEDINIVAGVFCFRFGLVPVTEDDHLRVKLAIRKAVSSLFDRKLQEQLKVISKKHQNMAAQLLPNITVHNTMGEENVPGYYPKYPFLKK
ncbi:hypothetical protein PGUG_03096 [Meyerozyma guilliermondii ATCC 6260]|uniref:Uncharacterized protein n=1 Tax=Meyerozyma guilliermondii (strain ATCC 6260 / CBS 566 / DSM 6381 / JCM 1539 / NBRC 10279 / NRRL Y-324) TaxID=294746 RepID=A5DIJ5_PICGU|nr:uncharacterized protein PGUG_03096 [Meyerozyma guilliermondii ATCC 6260]EDK38998.2 hypothetical protein PGUG_03096 [Meyerozyma guilliermondii ATCC 6260]